MKIRCMDHLALLVADVARSHQFYSQVLALPEIPRPRTFGFPGAWFRCGTSEIHLIGEAEVGRAAVVQPACYREDELAIGFNVHLAFEVDDVADIATELAAREIPLVGGPRERGDGVQQIYCCDPDGYVIEFFSRTGTPVLG